MWTQVIDPMLQVHAFTHDARHRLTQYTAPAVLGGSPVWTYEWDTNGRLRRSVNPVGTATGLDYDTQGRLIREVVDLNGDGTAESVQQYERDAQGDIHRRGSIRSAGGPTTSTARKARSRRFSRLAFRGRHRCVPRFGWSTTAPEK